MGYLYLSFKTIIIIIIIRSFFQFFFNHCCVCASLVIFQNKTNLSFDSTLAVPEPPISFYFKTPQTRMNRASSCSKNSYYTLERYGVLVMSVLHKLRYTGVPAVPRLIHRSVDAGTLRCTVRLSLLFVVLRV